MKPKEVQRLLDGMPPHIAEKVDKLVSNMKQSYDLALESWNSKNRDGFTEKDKHLFIEGFAAAYKLLNKNNE